MHFPPSPCPPCPALAFPALTFSTPTFTPLPSVIALDWPGRMTGTRSRKFYDEASKVVEHWREHATFLLHLGRAWAHLIGPTLHLLGFCDQEEVAANLAVADNTLRAMPRGRLLTPHGAWERHQTDANLERWIGLVSDCFAWSWGSPSMITLGGGVPRTAMTRGLEKEPRAWRCC
jgi:hypothetical protein